MSIARAITDWDDAYANGPNVPGGDKWSASWIAPARAYREAAVASGRARLDIAYGSAPREAYDLFLPSKSPRGLVIFVHGGYWRALDKSYWSQLAAGPIAHGHAVAMLGYSLCPNVRIRDITKQIAAAIIAAAAEIAGPIDLMGHSAGGHLVARQVCADSRLRSQIRGRIRNVVAISGVHDLRPLRNLTINSDLQLDAEEAAAESPALLMPLPGVRITCWAGAGERAEFIRQNALLANVWTGLGARTREVLEQDRHHYNVIDGLTDPRHPLVGALLEPT